MELLTRNLLPVVERRRRTNRRQPAGPVRGGIGRHDATPSRIIALVALATVRRAQRPQGRPAAWAASAFAREVDLVRLHLAPIRSRSGLATSFGREAFHTGIARDSEDAGPVAAAYTMRWLELGDGIGRPPWEEWVAATVA